MDFEVSRRAQARRCTLRYEISLNRCRQRQYRYLIYKPPVGRSASHSWPDPTTAQIRPEFRVRSGRSFFRVFEPFYWPHLTERKFTDKQPAIGCQGCYSTLLETEAETTDWRITQTLRGGFLQCPYLSQLRPVGNTLYDRG